MVHIHNKKNFKICVHVCLFFNRHVLGSEMTNDDLMTAMANDVIDLHHCVDHDHDRVHVLVNDDVVDDIVSRLHDDRKSIGPNNDKIHDEDNIDKEAF